MIAILLAMSLINPQIEYVINCRDIAAPPERIADGGIYCTFPNGDIAKQLCEDPANEGTENCVLGHVPRVGD